MPWCPRCDEVFPEGPACPRCAMRLVEREGALGGDELQAVPELATLKVSRRDRRALERLSGPKVPSSRVLAAAVAALVFAVGFLAGRLGSIEPDVPSVRALPAAEALSPFDVEGSGVYLLWNNDPMVTVAVHDLYSGDVVPRARLSPPFEATQDVRTSIAALGGSVALVVGDEGSSYVAVAAAGRPVQAWMPGVEAAWVAPDRLLVREAGGAVSRWTFGGKRLEVEPAGRADRLFQAPAGAVLERDGRLVGASGRGGIDLPRDAGAVATDGRRALIERDGELALWDGRTERPLRLQGARAVAASFQAYGDELAVVVRRGEELTLAVVDARGHAALKPLGARPGRCTPSVSWDRSGSWVYVAPGDRSLHAVEAAGGRVEAVRTHAVGCGLAWIS